MPEVFKRKRHERDARAYWERGLAGGMKKVNYKHPRPLRTGNATDEDERGILGGGVGNKNYFCCWKTFRVLVKNKRH